MLRIEVLLVAAVAFRSLQLSTAQSCGTGLPWLETRLTGGSTELEGRVEIMLNNHTWKSICDMSFDRTAADVVCRYLGYGYSLSMVSGSGFGVGGGAVYQPIYRCRGDEGNLGCCPPFYNSDGDQCTNSREIGIVCSGFNLTEGSLRWADAPTSPHRGRLELYMGSRWGTICYHGWGRPDALVACRQMGFSDGAKQSLYYTAGGEASQPIWFDRVDCAGSESSLLECGRSPRHSCQHSTDVGVWCLAAGGNGPLESPQPLPVRLGGGRTTLQGRVEVFTDGRWKLTCGRGWDQTEGHVVCRQLGLGHSVAVTSGKTLEAFPTRNVSVWGETVDCIASERSLAECSRVELSTSAACGADEAVAVYCSGQELSSGSVQLVSASYSGGIGGRIEVFLNGSWGTVCRSGWGQMDAQVICRQMGFISVDRDVYSAGLGPDSQTVWWRDLGCSGNESTLRDCPKQQPADGCGHFDDAGVSCYNEVEHSLRLSGGGRGDEGYIQMFQGQWVPICNSDFDTNDATVACRQLGYNTTGLPVTDQRFSKSMIDSGTLYWPVSFDCEGTENALVDCIRRYARGCTAGQYIGVVCSRKGIIQPPSATSSSGVLIVGVVVGVVLLLLLLLAVPLIVGAIVVCVCLRLKQARGSSYRRFGAKHVKMSHVAA